MQRRPAQGSIVSVATGVTLVVGRLLWYPVKLLLRPIVARRWNRRLGAAMDDRPVDRVNVFDGDGQLLGWGLRMDIDRTHVGYAIPFVWSKRAAVVKDVFGHEIRGARFYLGRWGWLAAPRRAGSRSGKRVASR
jgi:hypothetical protein